MWSHETRQKEKIEVSQWGGRDQMTDDRRRLIKRSTTLLGTVLWLTILSGTALPVAHGAAQTTDIIISCDNAYQLYVNGQSVGSGAG